MKWSPREIGPRRFLRRVAVVLGTGALALSALAQQSDRREQRRAALEVARESGALERHPQLGRAVAREPDPVRGRLLVAQALVGDELDASWMRELAPARIAIETRAGPQRLAQARALAEQALAQHPASVEARWILACATWLTWLEQRDPRLYLEMATWETPLRAAIALAPNDPQPKRLLALAYLEVWFALSDEQRQRGKALMEEAFADPATFERMLGRWLQAASDPREALASVPDRPDAWKRLVASLAEHRNWDVYRDARAAWDDALERHLRRLLAQADERLLAGDADGARALFVEVMTTARPERRFAELVGRAVERCPPGPVDVAEQEALRAWLDWALDVHFLGGYPFAPRVLDRLAGLAGRLPEQDAAMAALAAGKLQRAELYERRSVNLWSEGWGPYLIVKAEALAARGDLDGARGALAQVHRDWQAHPRYWRARQTVAKAAGDWRTQAAAEQELRGLVRAQWPATAWIYRGARARLNTFTAAGPGPLRIALDVVPETGVVVEVRWDGAALGRYKVFPGRPLVIPRPIEAGVHLIEIETLAGGGVVPGAVELGSS